MAGLVVILLLSSSRLLRVSLPHLNPICRFSSMRRSRAALRATSSCGRTNSKGKSRSLSRFRALLNCLRSDRRVMITDDGNIRKLAISKLAGKAESDWHKEPHYYLGTDRYGRDVFSRLMYGARVSLTVAFFSELLSIVIGVLLGAIAGFYRGWVDDVIMWFTNVVWSIPPILLVISISIALGLGFIQTVVAIGITGWVDMARIVRGQFFSLRETEYVEATKALGLSMTCAPTLSMCYLMQPNWIVIAARCKCRICDGYYL